jgi:hypothetical protein
LQKQTYCDNYVEMSNPASLFVPVDDDIGEAAMVSAAIECVEAFTDRFNARDLEGMDARLHFPHVILSGEQLVIWDKPGQLPSTFFDDLSKSSGWHHTRYQAKRPALVSPRKVHLVVEYTRNRPDGSVITSHRNLWIVTFDRGRWGIKQRSY